MTTNCVLQRNRELRTSSSHMIVNTTPPRNSEATVPCKCCMIATANTCDQPAFRPPSQISLCEALKTKRGSKSRSLWHANVSARNTDRNCNVWIVLEPRDPWSSSHYSLFFFLPVQIRSRADANLGLRTLPTTCAASKWAMTSFPH